MKYFFLDSIQQGLMQTFEALTLYHHPIQVDLHYHVRKCKCSLMRKVASSRTRVDIISSISNNLTERVECGIGTWKKTKWWNSYITKHWDSTQKLRSYYDWIGIHPFSKIHMHSISSLHHLVRRLILRFLFRLPSFTILQTEMNRLQSLTSKIDLNFFLKDGAWHLHHQIHTSWQQGH